MSNMANVIFRYSVTPSYGCCGDSDGGFALTLTDGGDVEYCRKLETPIALILPSL